MGVKSRGNYALTGSLTQEKFDAIFPKKLYSIHTSCPDDCTFDWTSKEIAVAFDILIGALETLHIGEVYEINEDLTVMRDQ